MQYKGEYYHWIFYSENNKRVWKKRESEGKYPMEEFRRDFECSRWTSNSYIPEYIPLDVLEKMLEIIMIPQTFVVFLIWNCRDKEGSSAPIPELLRSII